MLARSPGDSFRVLTVGWDFDVIERLADPIEKATGFPFFHVLDPAFDRRSLGGRTDSRFFFMRDDVRMTMPPADPAKLAELEQPGVPTIHNMIMGDRLLKTIDYGDALAYASYLAARLKALFLEIKPAVIIGGFDSVHSGIGMAVARQIGIPWFALNFTAIPQGLSGFCSAMSPDSSFSFLPTPPEELRTLAERTLHDFEAKRMVVPAYLSANNISMIFKRLPHHLRALYRSVRLSGDRYTQFSTRHLAREYIRKRKNLFFLPKQYFLDAPPETPYVFFGLHMQPESSIDVWAPYFSDQYSVVEAIARSTPPTHSVLVKLHKSDADNYSRSQLDRMRQLPGVRLVSPYASSRSFIERAAVVFAIQGNIAMEAGLLGRPVLLFGNSKFSELPSVTKVKRMTDLPTQIRAKLEEPPPEREAIVRGLMSYLSFFAPGCYNNWERTMSASEVDALANHFRALRKSLEERQSSEERSERCAG